MLALFVPTPAAVPKVIPPFAGAKSNASPLSSIAPMSGKNLPKDPDAVLYPYTPSVPLPVNLTPAELALTRLNSLPESPYVTVVT